MGPHAMGDLWSIGPEIRNHTHGRLSLVVKGRLPAVLEKAHGAGIKSWHRAPIMGKT